MSQLRDVALVGRFVLELLAIAAVSWWGFQLDAPSPVRVIAGLVAPAAVIVVWATFVSPRPRIVVAPPLRLAIELVVWVVAVLAIVDVPAILAAIIFALLVITDLLALWLTRHTPGTLDQVPQAPGK